MTIIKILQPEQNQINISQCTRTRDPTTMSLGPGVERKRKRYATKGVVRLARGRLAYHSNTSPTYPSQAPHVHVFRLLQASLLHIPSSNLLSCPLFPPLLVRLPLLHQTRPPCSAIPPRPPILATHQGISQPSRPPKNRHKSW